MAGGSFGLHDLNWKRVVPCLSRLSQLLPIRNPLLFLRSQLQEPAQKPDFQP